MFRIIRLLLYLSLLGLVALTGYAFLGDLAPVQRDVEEPVTLTPG